MQTPTESSLTLRLERLEQEFARELAKARRASRPSLRRTAGAFVAGIVGAFMLMAAGFPDSFAVVRTKRLEIVDEQNRVLGLFTATGEGSQLDMWNMTGTNVARLTSSASGGDLSMWSSDGKPSLGAFVSEGGGRFEVYDEGGRTMGRLAASRTGGEMLLQTPLGKPGVIARSDERGGGIAACDTLGRPLAELSVSNGSGLALVADRNGRPVAKLTSSERGGAIEIDDVRGGDAFSAGADVGGGSFTLTSSEGTALLSAGAGQLGGGTLDVRNATGAPVVTASAGDQGSGRFSVATADGNRGVTMQASASGYTLSFLEMARRVLLLESNAGGGRMELTDPAGKAATVLGVDQSTKCGAIALRGSTGQEVGRVSADDKGNGALTVYNQSGTERKVFTVR